MLFRCAQGYSGNPLVEGDYCKKGNYDRKCHGYSISDM